VDNTFDRLKNSPEPLHPTGGGANYRKLVLVAIVGAGLAFAVRSGALEGAWERLTGQLIGVAGEPVPATHSRLSDHNIEWLQKQTPQRQMEFLLGAAINHDKGATEMIANRVDGWHGKLHRTKTWQNLEMTALYSNDLRVRAAAIEINLAVNHLAKNEETAARLMRQAEADPSARPWVEWEIGMLANRGVRPERTQGWLADHLHDSNEQVRFWAVEGLAHIGTDETIKTLIEVLGSDPAAAVRERAGCSLAKSGMLTREQRVKAVPGLLDLADNPSLDVTTRSWVYQALREITDEAMPNDPAWWRNWWSTQGERKLEEVRRGEQWSVLGNG